MNWNELIDAVAAHSGTSRADARKVLTSFTEVVTDALVRGEKVAVRRLFIAEAKWSEPRTLRSIVDFRKMKVEGRWTPKLRPTTTLRAALSARTGESAQTDPRHREAQRVAEVLISDLALYYKASHPKLKPEQSLDAVEAACDQSFGAMWRRAREAFAEQVPPDVAAQAPYLLTVARERFSNAS